MQIENDVTMKIPVHVHATVTSVQSMYNDVQSMYNDVQS